MKSVAFAHINVARAWEIAGRRLADVALGALTKNIEEVSIVELCFATQCSNDRPAGQCKKKKSKVQYKRRTFREYRSPRKFAPQPIELGDAVKKVCQIVDCCFARQ